MLMTRSIFYIFLHCALYFLLPLFSRLYSLFSFRFQCFLYLRLLCWLVLSAVFAQAPFLAVFELKGYDGSSTMYPSTSSVSACLMSQLSPGPDHLSFNTLIHRHLPNRTPGICHPSPASSVFRVRTWIPGTWVIVYVLAYV